MSELCGEEVVKHITFKVPGQTARSEPGPRKTQVLTRFTDFASLDPGSGKPVRGPGIVMTKVKSRGFQHVLTPLGGGRENLLVRGVFCSIIKYCYNSVCMQNIRPTLKKV